MELTVMIKNLQEAMADATEHVKIAVMGIEGVDWTPLSTSYSNLCGIACEGGCQFVLEDGDRNGEKCGKSCSCEDGRFKCVDGHSMPIPLQPNLSTELLIAGSGNVMTSEEKFRKLAESIDQMTAAAPGNDP